MPATAKWLGFYGFSDFTLFGHCSGVHPASPGLRATRMAVAMAAAGRSHLIAGLLSGCRWKGDLRADPAESTRPLRMSSASRRRRSASNRIPDEIKPPLELDKDESRSVDRNCRERCRVITRRYPLPSCFEGVPWHEPPRELDEANGVDHVNGNVQLPHAARRPGFEGIGDWAVLRESDPIIGLISILPAAGKCRLGCP